MRLSELAIIIIMLAYLYSAAYTRLSMNESSPPCEQRRITFNDDGQRVQLARPELPAPHYIWCTGCYQLDLPSPSRHYYSQLIAGTDLPTPKGRVAWLAKADCMHIIFAKVITQLNPKAPEGNEPRLSGPRPTQYQWSAPYIIGRELNLRKLPGRQCLPNLLPFVRYSQSKCAWPWPLEYDKVKCKYANEKAGCYFIL